MKLKNLSYVLFPLMLLSAVFIAGCDDSGVTPENPGGTPGIPAIRLRTNSTFIYTYDSIPNGGNPIRKRRGIYDVVGTQFTLAGFLCFPIRSTTTDTALGLTTRDTLYVRYDSTGGKFYQYGIGQLINPAQPPTWDILADFNVAYGTQWTIGTINYTVPLPPPYNSIAFSGPLTAKVVENTTIQTTGSPSITVKCYRIELNANISGTWNTLTIAASIFLDYYLGYYSSDAPNNPSGLVRLTQRPFSFTLSGNPVLPEPGFDRILYSYTIAP